MPVTLDITSEKIPDHYYKSVSFEEAVSVLKINFLFLSWNHVKNDRFGNIFLLLKIER